MAAMSIVFCVSWDCVRTTNIASLGEVVKVLLAIQY